MMKFWNNFLKKKLQPKQSAEAISAKDEIMFKTSKELPPKEIYNRAVELFGIDFEKGTTFTVGDTIYSKGEISPDLLEHEKVHIKQQASGWREWWERYFTDTAFRTTQELEAYQEQYRWVLKNIKDRNERARYLMFFAQSLSGKMYGNVLSLQDAMFFIKRA